MKTTIVIDSHGCAHIWKGLHAPMLHPTLPTVNGQEADLFVQSCTSIDDLKEYLNSAQIEELENGYPIHANTLPAEYFNTI